MAEVREAALIIRRRPSIPRRATERYYPVLVGGGRDAAVGIFKRLAEF
jgi:hypothetical protein